MLKPLLIITVFFAGVLFMSCEKQSSELVDAGADTALLIPGSADGVITFNNTVYHAGDTIYGFKRYVMLIVGDKDVPLMLGIPHDGVAVGSPEIPETGDTGRDINTNPFATAIATLFKEETGKRPWVIINNIARKRVDPNSYPDEVDERYTHADAKSTWQSYHELMAAARAVMSTALQHKTGGIFIDVHGHAHKYVNGHQVYYTSATSGNQVLSDFIDQTEIGYGLSSHSLEQNDAYLNNLADSSSVNAIADAHPAVPFSALIRGVNSFGGMLQAQSIIAVPGSVLQILNRNATLFGTSSSGAPARRPYFTGGYLTRKYGTVALGSTIGYNDNISSLQIETPGITVRNNPSIIAVSAPRFKRAIINYLNTWFGYTYTNTK